MNNILLSLSCFFSIACFSQNNSAVTFDVKGHLAKQRKDTTKPKIQATTKPFLKLNTSTTSPSYLSGARVVGTSKLGKLYALPNSNMPCIVPDMKQFQSMPNIGDKTILEKPIDPGILLPQRKPFAMPKQQQ